jgi:hypothetical protein
MDYITIDGKLSIEGATISQKRLNNTVRLYNVLYAYFFIWAIDAFNDRLTIALDTGRVTRWISAGFFGVVILIFVLVIAEALIRRSWKRKIDISQISRIRVAESDEGLETHVFVTLNSKRYKQYKFRTLEKQYAGFVETIQSINPGIQIKTA